MRFGFKNAKTIVKQTKNIINHVIKTKHVDPNVGAVDSRDVKLDHLTLAVQMNGDEGAQTRLEAEI
jgi:hypothetical protein